MGCATNASESALAPIDFGRHCLTRISSWPLHTGCGSTFGLTRQRISLFMQRSATGKVRSQACKMPQHHNPACQHVLATRSFPPLPRPAPKGRAILWMRSLPRMLRELRTLGTLSRRLEAIRTNLQGMIWKKRRRKTRHSASSIKLRFVDPAATAQVQTCDTRL